MLSLKDLSGLVKYVYNYDVEIYHDPQGILKAGTGATVWDSSMVLAKYLEKQLEESSDNYFKQLRNREHFSILELGSGTGLVGLILHSLFPNATLCLSDQESMLPLLLANIKEKERIQVKELNWGNKEHMDLISKEFGKFDLIIHSDLITWPALYSSLIETLDYFSKPKDTMIVFSHESRDFEKEAKFYAKLSKTGFTFKNVESNDQDEIFRAEEIFLFVVKSP